MISRNFWRGRRVLLTGHTGFKGSWLAALLTELGAKTCGVSLAPTTTPNHFALLQGRLEIESHLIDIRNFELLRKQVRTFQPEVVFHLAAQALVRESYSNPIETYQTNVMGTAHLLQSCRDLSSLKSIVVVTSDKCYENVEQVWGYREHDRLGGYDPYSNSKACAELVADAWKQSFFKEALAKNELGLATARAGNVIGGGDWSTDRLIPDIIRAYGKGASVRIRNPRSIRPWQHVLDPLMGYLLLAERLFLDPKRFSRPWNFGPLNFDSACEVSRILEKARIELGPGFQSEIDPGPHPHEANYLKLDCSLAAEELRWRPVWEVDQALRSTFQWYKAFLENPTAGAGETWKQVGAHLDARTEPVQRVQ